MCIGNFREVTDSIEQFFRKLVGRPVEDLDLTGKTPVKVRAPRRWWQFPFRLIYTSRGGLNMPRYQPCPKCRAGSKRIDKSMGGATYICPKGHGSFFVTVPGGSRVKLPSRR